MRRLTSTLPAVIVERSMNDDFLSNTYLVADEPGGHAVMIDAGGPVQPLLDYLKRGQLTLTHILLTHHHHDHVSEVGRVLERHPGTPVLIHELERERGAGGDRDDGAGREDRQRSPGDRADPHARPHRRDAVAARERHRRVHRATRCSRARSAAFARPAHSSYADLRSSIMDKLLELPPATRIHPGHTDPTTVADELEHNRFVRIWRGVDPEGTEPCIALGEPATLILLGDDYDGGHKAWVRWPDGSDDIVPGSRVERGR